MIDYEGFETEQVTVELRYPTATTLWDGHTKPRWGQARRQ